MNDDERASKAREERGQMVGPWETDRCKHGKLFSFRWTWPKGGGPEVGEPEMGRSGCKACESE